jgi:hypothetical protein
VSDVPSGRRSLLMVVKKEKSYRITNYITRMLPIRRSFQEIALHFELAAIFRPDISIANNGYVQKNGGESENFPPRTYAAFRYEHILRIANLAI